MNLLLRRYEFGGPQTFGKLYVDGSHECETLEDQDRMLEEGGTKVYGETCIPRGKYLVIVDYSQRFKKDLPRLLNVPGFEGIRIHPGNTVADTLGCILVGMRRIGNQVQQSRLAFDALFQKLEAAYDAGEGLELEIV